MVLLEFLKSNDFFNVLTSEDQVYKCIIALNKCVANSRNFLGSGFLSKLSGPIDQEDILISKAPKRPGIVTLRKRRGRSKEDKDR